MQSTDEVTDIITVDAVATEVKSEPANINDKLNLKPKAERKPTVKTPPAEQTGAAAPDHNDELM
jgi:hypothetical protein